MGYKDLKEAVGLAFPKLKDDPFRATYLLLLFEIAGSLDAMSFSARALVELAERQLKIFEQISKHLEREQELMSMEAGANARRKPKT